jgi:hypothetical protein
MSPQLEYWQWLLIGAAILLLLTWFTSRRRRGPRQRKETRAELDARDPLRRWCHAGACLVSRDCDYGHLPRGDARRMLQRWWHVHGPRELHQVLRSLGNSPNPDNAWELLRFILVARLGAAAEMIDDDDSWSMIAPIATRLQDAYLDWSAMAQAYVRARRQWQELALDGSQDDDTMRWISENLQSLRAGTWTQVPWDLELEDE